MACCLSGERCILPSLYTLMQTNCQRLHGASSDGVVRHPVTHSLMLDAHGCRCIPGGDQLPAIPCHGWHAAHDLGQGAQLLCVDPASRGA